MRNGRGMIKLGSIIQIKGDYKDYAVISRGIILMDKGKKEFYDYGVVLYPEGLKGDEINYIKKESVEKVVFEGYNDDSNIKIEGELYEYIKNNWSKK